MNSEINANEMLPVSPVRPSGVFGAGSLTGIVWNRGNSSRFSIFHTDRYNGQVTNLLTPTDVADLAKLVTLLAKIFHEDDQLAAELRDDLGCLASCLEEVFPPAEKHERFPETVARSMIRLMDYLIDNEGDDFLSMPSTDHIYRHLLVIDAWFRGVSTHFCQLEDLATFGIPTEGFSLCPICGQNDGFFSVQRDNWFYCDRHQVRWLASQNVFASWETNQSRNFLKQVCQYREVAPYMGNFQTEERV